MQTPEEFLETQGFFSGDNFHWGNLLIAICSRDAEWQARDAEIRRECAERAQDEWEQLFCDDMIGDREFVTKKLRAAIKGALHE